MVDAWKAIVGEKTRREEAAKAEAERIATEKEEAERKAAEERERAEAEEEARVEAERKAEEERIAKEEERKERDENGQPFVVSSDGTTIFGEITEDTGLTAAPIKLSEGFQDANTGKGYGLVHIEANHGEQIRQAGFTSVKEFVSFVATHYDPDNIRVGKRRDDGSDTFLIQVTDTHDNTLFIELSKDGSYWNVNSGGIFRKGYSNKKETVAKTEPQQPTNAVSSDSSLSANVKDGITNAEPNGEPTVSLDKGTTLPADQQTSDKENTKKVADSEGENTLKAKIEAASADVNTEPTEAQKEAGNYKKGHVQVGTFDITIEQPEGSIRRGTDADGKKWEIKMHNTYGYFRGTEGVDGDHIDVFLSNDIDGWNGRKVFVVDQYNPDGTFDEHKVMLGFNDMDKAKSDYLANYEKGWENGRRITVSTTNLEDFKKWIDSSHRKTKPFSEYSSVNKETVATDKGGKKAEKKQKKQSVFDKAKEIADKEEKKRKAEADKPKQKPLTEAERKDAEEVAGALGYRVEWVDTMEENGTIDADRKVILIAKDAENPLVQVLGHEVAHGVKRMNGGKFKALQKAAMEVVGEKEWNERIEKKRKLNAYAEGKLAEEVTCDIVGEALNNKDALKRLAESLRGERGILARLRDAVAKMVEYFKNRGDKDGVRRMKAADKLLAEFESALKEGVTPEQVKPEGVDRSVRESGDEPENKRRKDFAERFGVDESYVSDYANGMAQRNTGKAARARRSMERQIYLANAGKTSKLSDIAKSFKPFRAALKEAFGDLDALIDEYRKLFEEERNMMEAARKKAEDEAAARKRHLDELSLLTDGQIDSRYAEALEKGDETEAREMLDEVARRKGYGDENNEYRMQHRAPSNPGYESDEARRNDIENGPDVNLEDIALGYNIQPDDYFTNPRGYGNDTPHGRESTDAVANALSSIRQGGRDVTVKVYRAVPTTMKEGKLRNGDWVTLSRRYAEMHGNHALNGKYRIMEDEVPAKDIWWDGNDVNEFGYDNGEDYKYKNVKNNRKSDDLVTRDDKGNVIPPSKRFNQRKADERYSRRESKALTAEERELRDNLVERMRKGGLDVVTDSEEMQRVIDTENERTRNKRSKKSEAARKRDEALYAVDWSTAFVSGKSREEATEIRRERGRKFKEETKELYGRVLSGNFDDVTLRLIDKFVDNSTPNNPYERPISKRLPARALQKMRGGERTGSIDALFSRISESAVGKDGKALPRAERERAIEEKKKELLKKWAIATGNWHTDIADFTDQREPIGSGTDSDVYLGKDGKSVIKVSKGKPYGKRFRPDVDNVALFNTVFPGSRYTIEGYGKVDGKFVRFLKQPIVDFTSSTPLTEGERVAYMEKLGFKPINKENTAFSNGEIIASDLQKSNIVKDKQGNVRVIDADMKLHTKDFGGKFSYPDAETDTRTAGGEVYTGSVREHRVYHGSGADFDAFDHSHMGEGEGAQAYGWGTYVTEVEGIGRTYAIQNTTKHNDALRALQHDVDAISDQLNRHRDDLKYDEEQLKRANEWRAEAELDYELFRDEAEKLKEKYGEASPKYRNHLFNDIYTDEMKRAQSSVKSMEESIQYRKEKIAELEKALKDKQAEIDELPKEFPRHLYTVEIPDDNGSNYLDWNGHPAESLLKDVGSFLESEGFERVQDSPVRYEKGESTVVLNPNATGADLYAELREALGSDKKASQALAELGCIGIKYPADNMRGGREDGAKNYVIFNENDAKITDHIRFLRTAGGEVYGLVKDGRIYLDPKVATSETAVHEYTHLWGDMLRRKDSEQWNHTVKELKNSVLWEEVKESYPELKTDDEIADEVLSTFSGRRGAERLREEARRVADGEGGVFTKAKAIETLERVKEAIARFWEGVARMFGINRYRSAEELADMAMRDLINGVKPTSRTFTFDNFYKDTKAVFEGTERPKGKPDYTSYSGSEYWYGEDKGGKYVVRGSDHWSGEFKVKDGERTNVGRNHYSEITEDGMLPIGAQGSLKFGWEKGLSKPVGSGISAAIDRRGSGDSNNIASCYWYIDNAKEKDNKGFTYGKAYLSEFEDKERRRDIPGDDWRDIQGLEGGTRAMAERIAEQPVEEINNRFNEELEKYQNNELPKGHRFELGMPSAELQSAGFPTLPISMRSSLLAKKAGAERHPFAPTDLRDLVNAIQKPIAIFNYSKNNMRNLIVDVSRGGKHFLVGVTLNYKADNIEINSVSGLFPKENHEWIKWIQDGKVLRIDQKEKVQDLINSLRTNPAESERIGLNLDDVAKKVKDFENPKLFGEEIIDDGKKGSDSIDRSVRENPKNEDKPRFSRKPGESIFDYASRVSEDVDRSVRERVSARDEYEKKVKSKGFQTKEALQNSMLGLQEFMSAIDHASGNKRYIEDIPDFENPILGENRLSSVNKEEMHQVAKTQFKPLMSAVAKLSGNGKESGELYDYMFAKHGLERDAVMRQREAQKEFDKYQKANPKGTKTIGDFVASLEGKDYAGLTALTAEDGRVKSIQSQIDAIDEQMKATDDQLLLRKLGGQKKRLKVDLLNAARDAADDIRKAFESDPNHNLSDINELWKRVNEVNGNTLRKLYESGMLTKEAYNDISSMYTNYIPMRGFDQTTSADAYAYLTHGDSAFNAPIKTAKGRSSKADNPIAYMQAMAESAIMQGNRNVLVKQKMLNFVRNHPSDLASVSDVWLQYDSVADEWKPVFPDNIGANDSASVVAKKMEAFEDKMKQMAEKHPDLVQRSNEAPDIPYKVVEKGQLNEHQVLVKQNGKSYIITVNGSPRAAQAANGLTNPDTDLTGAVGKVFEGAEALNRQLSSLYTTLNPDFIGSNYVRDALYSNTMVYVKEGAKYGGSFNLNFAKYNPAEMANLYARYNKGSLDTSNETHRLFLEFMQNGGETGFVNLKQIEKRKSEIAKAIKRDGRISAAQIWGGLNDAIDFANRAVENSARFAAYVTSRKSGRSVGRSVYDAKEISVNFNRKGSGRNWWKDNVGTSRFYDTEIGLVEINRASVGSSLAHRYSQVKLDVITSLAEGFNNAVYFGSMQDFSRQEGVKSHYFAYPINYNGNRNYVFCRAMQDANKSRLYVHEVFFSG